MLIRLFRSFKRVGAVDAVPGWDMTNPQQHSSLPPEADDVRELNQEVKRAVRTLLATEGLGVIETELRRRLSICEYRMYVTLATLDRQHGLPELEKIGQRITAQILSEFRVQIAQVFWQYRSIN